MPKTTNPTIIKTIIPISSISIYILHNKYRINWNKIQIIFNFLRN